MRTKISLWGRQEVGQQKMEDYKQNDLQTFREKKGEIFLGKEDSWEKEFPLQDCKKLFAVDQIFFFHKFPLKYFVFQGMSWIAKICYYENV